MPTIEISISSSGDDGFSWPTGFSTTDTIDKAGLEFGDVDDAFLRFQSVAIPQGVTIDVANLVIVQGNGQDGSGVKTNIHCNDEDDATAPTTRGEHTGKSRTTAFTAWDDASIGIGEFTTPDFASAVQEVIDRPGWGSGNDLMLLIDDDTSDTDKFYQWASFDHATLNAPKLHIEYSVDDPTPSVVPALLEGFGREMGR